jgi:hypothetical protein
MEIRSIYHYPVENIMVDEDGRILYDIFRIISPSIFNMYKKQRGTYYIETKDPNILYRFIFPLEEELDEYV